MMYKIARAVVLVSLLALLVLLYLERGEGDVDANEIADEILDLGFDTSDSDFEEDGATEEPFDDSTTDTIQPNWDLNDVVQGIEYATVEGPAGPRILDNSRGLAPVHIAQTPIYELVYTPRRFGESTISRLYSDGSLYYFTEPQPEQRPSLEEAQWIFIARKSSETTDEIRDLLWEAGRVFPHKTISGYPRDTQNWVFESEQGMVELCLPVLTESPILLRVLDLINRGP